MLSLTGRTHTSLMTLNHTDSQGIINNRASSTTPAIIIIFDDDNKSTALDFEVQLKNKEHNVSCVAFHSVSTHFKPTTSLIIVSMLSLMTHVDKIIAATKDNELTIHLAVAESSLIHNLNQAVKKSLLYRFIPSPISLSNIEAHIIEAEQELNLRQQRSALLADIARCSNELDSLDTNEKSSLIGFTKGLHNNSHIDPLTNLPNRYLIFDRIKHAINVAQRKNNKVAILSIDIDRFSIINQSLGIRFGNQLLRDFSQRLVNCARQADSVAREGNDQFLLVMADIENSESVLQLIKRFQKNLAAPFIINQQEVFISVSIGVCIYPNDAQDPEALARSANTAMKHTKKLGGNSYYYFEKEMNSRIRKLIDMESSLFRALEKNEFQMYYQPQVNIQSGEVVGAEALLRWQRPGFGTVPPNEFIPILEETGLIQSVGEWILTDVANQNDKWLSQGLPPLRMSVNLSLRQVQDDSILTTVKNIITKFTASNRQPIELEITESIMMKDADKSISLLLELNKMGFNLAIDDFGTGYASLNYLTQFPVHSLKIDLSFVQRIGITEKDAAVVKAIIVMAHSLSLRVTAEGVETQQQLDFLAECGCNEFQGYYFSKPLPANEFEALVRSNKTLYN